MISANKALKITKKELIDQRKQLKVELYKIEKEIKYAIKNGRDHTIIGPEEKLKAFNLTGGSAISENAKDELKKMGYYYIDSDPDVWGAIFTTIYFSKTTYKKELKRIQAEKEAKEKREKEDIERRQELEAEQNELWEQRQKEINRTVTYKHYKNIHDFLKSSKETGITVKSEIFNSLDELKEIALAREEHTAYVFSDDYE